MIEKHRLDRDAVEDPKASPPVLALSAKLAALGQAELLCRERRILETRPERGQALERAGEVVADRFRLQVAIDPQDRLEALDRQRLAHGQLEALDQLRQAIG